MPNRIVQTRKLGKQNRTHPDIASSMILTDESTSIYLNTQLTNIEGIDTSFATYILLPNTTSDVLEEVSKCPKDESLHVSNKNNDICRNDDIEDYEKYF